MNVVIAGGTGFLGRHLTNALVADGHEIVLLSRHGVSSASARAVSWLPNGSVGAWAEEIEGAGAVVNLAGESIAARRWTAAQKARILESRVHATRSLAGAINGARRPPAVFVSGSAVGYYGPLGDEIAREDHAPGSDFLAGVCRQWEAEAARVSAAGTRVVLVRTGVVLARDGGALPKMLPPFWFGVGGPVGSGRQWWPWVHLSDWVGLVRWMIATPGASGPFNASAPQPEMNADFAPRARTRAAPPVVHARARLCDEASAR